MPPVKVETEVPTVESRPPSVLQNLKDSKKELKSKWAFAFFTFWCILKKSANGTVYMVICLILLLAFPLSMLAIGVINIYDCPADVYIPIFTLGWGLAAAIKIFLSLRVQYIAMRSRKHSEPNNRRTLTRFSKFFQDVETRELNHILTAGVLAASIGLAYMTYRTYGKWSPQVGATNYCNPRFYQFAFCSTTVILCLEFVCTCLAYPFTGAIVYGFLNVYDDVSDVRASRKLVERV